MDAVVVISSFVDRSVVGGRPEASPGNANGLASEGESERFGGFNGTSLLERRETTAGRMIGTEGEGVGLPLNGSLTGSLFGTGLGASSGFEELGVITTAGHRSRTLTFLPPGLGGTFFSGEGGVSGATRLTPPAWTLFATNPRP